MRARGGGPTMFICTRGALGSSMGGTVNRTVTLVDAQKWARRALVLDVFALLVLPIVAVALIQSSFWLGKTFTTAAATDFVNYLLVEVAIGVAAMAWLFYRVVRAAYREVSSPA